MSGTYSPYVFIMPFFSLNDPLFWAQFLLYFVAVLIAYYIPGYLLLRRLQMPLIFKTALSITLGMVLFAYQAYVLGYLNLRTGTYLYLTVCTLLWLADFRRKKRQAAPGRESHISGPLWALIITGAFMQLTTIWFTGVSIGGTAYYCCGNANDNFLYGSLSRQLVRSIPPEHPGMNGEIFRNYHYWSNIIVGETSRIFKLPVFQTQFQYSTVLISVGMGILLLALLWQLGAGEIISGWTLFFFYFGSDAIYWIIALLRSAPPFSMSSLEDGSGFLANYPRAMAVMVGVAAMTMLFYIRKKRSALMVLVTAVLFAGVAGMKIYVAFFLYVGLLCLALYDVLRKKSYVSGLVGVITLTLVLPVYMQTNSAAGGLYYLGFWRAQNFIVQPWLNLLRLEQARIIYETDHKWPQVLFYNALFTGVYVIAIYGTKIIALFNTRRSLRQLPTGVHIFLIPAIIASFILGYMYNQDTGESNTFNFLVSVFIFLSFYAALVMSNLKGRVKRPTYLALACLVILLTIPRPIYRTFRNITEIVTKRGFRIQKNIVNGVLAARSGTDPEAVFLINPKYFKFDTEGPVFSMLLDRPMYYSGEQFLYWFKASPSEVAKRKKIATDVFTSGNIIEVAASLKKTPVKYLVDAPSSLIGSTMSASFLHTFYKNFDIHIIRVDMEKIPFTVFEDAAESTGASVARFNVLVAPYLR